MQRAKVFSNGRSQAVRIPKEFRFNTSEVFIRKNADGDVILSTRDTDFNWQNFLKEMHELTGEERKEFVVDRNLIESKLRDLF